MLGVSTENDCLVWAKEAVRTADLIITVASKVGQAELELQKSCREVLQQVEEREAEEGDDEGGTISRTWPPLVTPRSTRRPPQPEHQHLGWEERAIAASLVKETISKRETETIPKYRVNEKLVAEPQLQ